MKKEQIEQTEQKEQTPLIYSQPNDEGFRQVVTRDAISLTFAKLHNQGDKLEGLFIGDYCKKMVQMGIEPQKKIEGWLFSTNEQGLVLIPNYYSIDNILVHFKGGEMVKVVRGTSVMDDKGNTKYVHFSVFVK